MDIQLNGKSEQILEGCTAAMLITQLDLAGQRIALEINGEIVPRSRHDEYELADGDQVEIVRAVGGG